MMNMVSSGSENDPLSFVFAANALLPRAHFVGIPSRQVSEIQSQEQFFMPVDHGREVTRLEVHGRDMMGGS